MASGGGSGLVDRGTQHETISRISCTAGGCGRLASPEAAETPLDHMATRSSANPPPTDLFPLSAVSDLYPPDVDVRLTNHSLPGKLYCSVCQLVRAHPSDLPHAHALSNECVTLTECLDLADLLCQ